MPDWNEAWGNDAPMDAPSALSESTDTTVAPTQEAMADTAQPEIADSQESLVDPFAFEDETQEATPTEFALPDNDDDLAPHIAQNQPWAREMMQTRALARSLQNLQTDHDALNAYQALGEREALQRQLEFARAFQTPRPDGQQGYTSTPAFQRLIEESPARAVSMLAEFAQLPAPDGQSTLLEALFSQLGVKPETFDAMMTGKLVPVQASPLTISAEEEASLRNWYGDNADKAIAQYKELSALERKAFWGEGVTEQEQDEALAKAQKRLDDTSTLKNLTSWQQQQEQEKQQAFAGEIRSAQAAYITELRESNIKEVVEGITSEVRFAADEKMNTALNGTIGAVLTSLLDPEFAFATMPLLEALGCKPKGDFYGQLKTAAEAAGEAKKWTIINGRQDLRQHHDRAALEAAERRQADALKDVKTVLRTVGLRLAKALGGTRKAQSEQIQQTIQRGTARPSVNGTPGSLNTQSQPTSQKEKWASVWT